MTDEVNSHFTQPKLLVHLLHGNAPQVHALMCLGVALVVVLYKAAAVCQFTLHAHSPFASISCRVFDVGSDVSIVQDTNS